MTTVTDARTCIDCAFFVKEHRDPHGKSYTSIVSPQERDNTRNGDTSHVKEHWSYSCYRGQWDECVAGKIRYLWNRDGFLFSTSCPDHTPQDVLKPGKMLQSYVSDMTRIRELERERILALRDQMHYKTARWSAVAAIVAAAAAWGSLLVAFFKH